ncbi:MAG: hypothetical protein JNK05_13185 [Myxococcales bacterium]|nr:hypothetical protein [Myxococcales bacterium]
MIASSAHLRAAGWVAEKPSENTAGLPVDFRYRKDRLHPMANVGAMLGAGPTAGTVQITLFIPSVDRVSKPIDQPFWRDEALRAFGTLFRGATAFPPGRGVWRDDAANGALVFDDTVLVTTYAAEADVTDEALAALRRFLHRLGREARQGEIGVIVDGAYHGITEYDADEEEKAKAK